MPTAVSSIGTLQMSAHESVPINVRKSSSRSSFGKKKKKIKKSNKYIHVLSCQSISPSIKWKTYLKHSYIQLRGETLNLKGMGGLHTV